MKAQQLRKARTIARRTKVPRSRWADLGLVFIVILVTALTGYVILVPADSRSALNAERVVPAPAGRPEVIPLDPAVKSAMDYIRAHETVSPESGIGAWCERLPRGMRRTAMFCRRVVRDSSLLNRFLPRPSKNATLDPQ